MKNLILILLMLFSFASYSQDGCGIGCESPYTQTLSFASEDDWVGYGIPDYFASFQTRFRMTSYSETFETSYGEVLSHFPFLFNEETDNSVAGFHIGDGYSIRIKPFQSGNLYLSAYAEFKFTLEEFTSCLTVDITSAFRKESFISNYMKVRWEYSFDETTWAEMGEFYMPSGLELNDLAPLNESFEIPLVTSQELFVRCTLIGKNKALKSPSEANNNTNAYLINALSISGQVCDFPQIGTWGSINTCLISPEEFPYDNIYSKGTGVHKYEIWVHSYREWNRTKKLCRKS